VVNKNAVLTIVASALLSFSGAYARCAERTLIIENDQKTGVTVADARSGRTLKIKPGQAGTIPLTWGTHSRGKKFFKRAFSSRQLDICIEDEQGRAWRIYTLIEKDCPEVAQQTKLTITDIENLVNESTDQFSAKKYHQGEEECYRR
jgi:hypothetical protein